MNIDQLPSFLKPFFRPFAATMTAPRFAYFVERDQPVGRVVERQREGLQRDTLAAATMLEPPASSCVIDEDASHRFCRRREQMPPARVSEKEVVVSLEEDRRLRPT